MDIIIVAAVAENGVIGRGNALPWRLKSDMAHFRSATMGKPVVLGRKTYQSIAKPLAGRTTIVVSRDASFNAPGIIVAPSFAAALETARGDAHLYNNHLEQARLQLTRQPRPLPTLRINPAAKDLFALHYEDFVLEGYEPHPHIKAAVAV